MPKHGLQYGPRLFDGPLPYATTYCINFLPGFDERCEANRLYPGKAGESRGSSYV